MDWESTQDAEWVAGNLLPLHVGGGHMDVSIGKKCKEREGEEPGTRSHGLTVDLLVAHQPTKLFHCSGVLCTSAPYRETMKGADSPVLGVVERGKSK